MAATIAGRAWTWRTRALAAVFRFGCLLAVAGCATIGGPRPDYDPTKPHHTPGGFRNVGEYEKSTASTLEWAAYWFDLAFVKSAGADKLPRGLVLSPAQVRRGLRRAQRYAASLTWIGHATTLMRVGKTTVLTDPFFSDFAAMAPLLGPRRAVPPALRIEDLPAIDVILISHNHYDHLDKPSLRRLARRNRNATVLVPLGNARFIRDLGFARVIEMDWYDRRRVAGLTFVSLPAQHGSRRGLFDSNRALWGGWGIIGQGRRIFFTGDTGMSSVFRQARRRAGPFDTAIVSIGAYAPRSREREDHATPEQTVEIARIMGARTVIATQWATMDLADEPLAEPGERFRRAPGLGLRKKLIRIGETMRL